MNQQQQWAGTLKKEQHRAKQRKTLSLADEKKRIEEEIDYYKEQLIAAAEKKAFDETKRLYEKVVEARARQLRNTLEHMEEKLGTIPQDRIAAETKSYREDCVKLALAADVLLGVRYAL